MPILIFLDTNSLKIKILYIYLEYVYFQSNLLPVNIVNRHAYKIHRVFHLELEDSNIVNPVPSWTELKALLLLI